MSAEAKAKRMAKLIAEIDDIERAKRESSKEFREQITQRWKELEALGGEVTTGQRRFDDAEPEGEGSIARAEVVLADGSRHDVTDMLDAERKRQRKGRQ